MGGPRKGIHYKVCRSCGQPKTLENCYVSSDGAWRHKVCSKLAEIRRRERLDLKAKSERRQFEEQIVTLKKTIAIQGAELTELRKQRKPIK